LFPGSSLPLHIFEERYRTLISECLEEGETSNESFRVTDISNYRW
jgi:Lon protease-like protein